MAGRSRTYTAEEARRIILELPDDPNESDDELFSGSDGETHARPHVSSSSSDSDSNGESEHAEILSSVQGRGKVANRSGNTCDHVHANKKQRVAGNAPHIELQWGPQDERVHVDYPQYTGHHGPTEPLGIDAKCVDFWEQLFPDNLISILVDETNRYVRQKQRTDWQMDTTVEEMRAFIGVLYMMGIHRLPQFRDYFSNDYVLGVPAVQAVFSRKRFWQLWSNIHLVDNENTIPAGQPGHDKLFKLRPFLQALRTSFREYFYIGQNVSVDEHMVKGKGRNPNKQYMPAKPVKRGTKIWELGCSDCSYLYDFQIYTGAAAGGEQGLSYRVVMDLVNPNLGPENHVLYIDNFFTGFPLIKALKEKDIYTVGTVRLKRKGFPDQLKNFRNLPRGEMHTCSEGTLTCTVWQDTKLVSFVSNAHSSHGNDTIQRRKKSGEIVNIQTPPCVKDYNYNMGAIDSHDQLQVYYAIDRKSRRWWMRIFLSMLDAVMVNAYILYSMSFNLVNNPMPHTIRHPMDTKKFRCAVIHDLIGMFTCRQLPGRQANYYSVVPVFERGHELVDLSELGMLKKGRCHECCLGRARVHRTETKFGCKICVKRLCPVPCHAQYHKRLFNIEL